MDRYGKNMLFYYRNMLLIYQNIRLFLKNTKICIYMPKISKKSIFILFLAMNLLMIVNFYLHLNTASRMDNIQYRI